MKEDDEPAIVVYSLDIQEPVLDDDDDESIMRNAIAADVSDTKVFTRRLEEIFHATDNNHPSAD